MNDPIRILLVDDSPSDRALALRELHLAGIVFTATEIATQPELDEALARGDFDLVITDYLLNWSDGLKVLDAIKQAKPDCPVIMFTGSGDEEIAVEALKRGLDDYVPKKPKRYSSLSASVLRTLRRYHELQAMRAFQQEQERVAQALRLNEKFAELGRMAGVIAHEINNPLEAVMNCLYLIRGSGQTGPAANAYVEAAEAELRRIAHITKQTLSFYRESNLPTETDLPQLLDSLLAMYAQRFNGHISINTSYGPVRPVMAYTSQIRQVFSNLIANALEALTPEGGRLSIRVRDAHSWNRPSLTGARVTISDTGKGVTRENRKRLFDAFFTTKGEKGTGLGLWVSYGIVVRHNGTIRVCSRTTEPHRGTAFSVFLPYLHESRPDAETLHADAVADVR